MPEESNAVIATLECPLLWHMWKKKLDTDHEKRERDRRWRDAGNSYGLLGTWTLLESDKKRRKEMNTKEILQYFLNSWNTRMQVCDGEIFRLTTEKDILQRCCRDVESALEKLQEKES